MSVTTLLSMPLAAGLFGQAIAQSGPGAHAHRDEGRMVAGYLAEALGVPAGPGLDHGGPAGQARAGRVGPGGGGADHPDPARWGSSR
jgi:para-nitrobenzyl esterase